LAIVSDKGPIARATIAQTGGVYSKLLDTTQYTGSHKQRFDADGIGRGAAGQDNGQANLTLQQVADRSSNSTVAHNTFSVASNVSGPANNTSIGAAKKRGQTAVITASVESLEIKNKPAKKADTHISQVSLNKASSRSLGAVNSTSHSLNHSVAGSTSSVNKPTAAGKTSGSGSVFDRLTNTNGYTGSHKARFNADGTGRGLAGRETAGKGAPVDGLAKILRN